MNEMSISEAVELGDIDLVKKLLPATGDINQTDDGKTVLHVVVARHKQDSLNLPTTRLETRSKSNRINKQVQMLRLILEQGPNINARDNLGKTALHYSAEYEQLDFINILIEAGADVNALDNLHDTALCIAARLHLSIHKMKCDESSIDYSHYPGQMTSKAKMKSRLVYLAQIVTALVTPAASVNIIDKDGYTALLYAVQTDNVQVVESLLAAGADVRIAANNGETVLHYAANSGCEAIHDVLLKDPNASIVINAKSTVDSHKRLKRFKRNQIDMYQHLANRESTLCFLERNDRRAQVGFFSFSGKTALMIALENGHNQISFQLLSHGADLNVSSDEGYSVLHFAVLGSCIEIMRHLLQRGCLVNKDMDGGSAEPVPPLVLAAALGEVEIVNILLEAGANVNMLSSAGMTPLMAAAACVPGSNWNSPLFQILHDHGADFNMTGKKGRTALMYLVKRGVVRNNIDKFIALGASLDIEDDDGRSAFVYYLLKDKKNFQLGFVKKLLGDNLLVNYKYRHLLMMHDLHLQETCHLPYFVAYMFDDLPVMPEESCFFLRLQICNGVVFKYTNFVNNTREECEKTALMLAIHYDEPHVTNYILASCFVTIEDLKEIRKIDQTTVGASDTPLKPELLKVLAAAVSEPWPLVKLAFITVSSMLGDSPGRDERLTKINLPRKLKQLLMFQSPVSFLPVSDWRQLTLCFDPIVYETLPRPRPLLYHWPLGIDLGR